MALPHHQQCTNQFPLPDLVALVILVRLGGYSGYVTRRVVKL